MKKAPIISIAHCDYICKSVSHAAELVKLLSSLIPCSLKHSHEYRDRWYQEEEDRPLNIELHASEEVRMKPKRLALPAPKRGTIRCVCGHSDVAPGHICQSCERPYNQPQ